MARTRGFTLLELMIVVLVIAVLSAIAMNTYGNYTYRARRAEGREMLLRVAAAQERYYTNFNRYGSLADVGFAGAVSSEKGYYLITAALGGNGLTFTLTASPQLAQAKDVCGPLTYDNVGAKGPAPAAAHTNGACW